MSSITLYRLSGLALLLGALIFATGNLIHPLEHSAEAYLSPTWAAAHILMIVGGMALVVGLPGLYLRQAKQGGSLLLASALLMAVAFMGIMPGSWFEAFVAPVISPLQAAQIENSGGLFNAIIGFMFMGSPVVLGVALLRARVFSRWAAILLILPVLLYLIGPALPIAEGFWIIPATVILAAGFAWLGYQLFSQPGLEVKGYSPEPARPVGQVTSV